MSTWKDQSFCAHKLISDVFMPSRRSSEACGCCLMFVCVCVCFCRKLSTACSFWLPVKQIHTFCTCLCYSSHSFNSRLRWFTIWCISGCKSSPPHRKANFLKSTRLFIQLVLFIPFWKEINMFKLMNQFQPHFL